MRAHLSTHDYEQISAYLDGQLSSREKVRFEQQLRDRSDLKTALEEMGRTRALLRMAPHRRAPRNFTLTPAMVQQDKPKWSFGFHLFPTLSFASALAALVLVATVLFELMPGVAPAMTGAVPEAAPMNDTNTLMQSAPTTEADAEAQKAMPGIAAVPDGQVEQPPVITWGLPPFGESSGSMFGKGGGPGIDTLGRGGFGGGSDMSGMGGGAPDGNLVVPLESVESLVQESPAQASEPQQNFDGIPTLEGSGPILGLPAPDQAGQYAAPVPTALPTRDLVSTVEDGFAVENLQSVNITPLRVVQLILGMVALITGLAAFLLWRRSR